MNVLFVTRSLEVGGAERQLSILASALAARGHRIRIVQFYSGGHFEGKLKAAGISVDNLAKHSRWDLVGPFLRFIRLIREHRPDIVYSFLGSANVAASLASCFCSKSKLVYGIRASNLDFALYDRLTRIVTRLESFLSPNAQLMIANSMVGLRNAQDRGMSTPGLVIPNGIDLATFRPDHTARTSWRVRLKIPEDYVVIGMLARRDPMKDHEGFLTAATLLASRLPKVAFILAGPGVDQSDVVLARMSTEVRATVHLLGNCSDASGLLASLDVCVLASHFGEGFPNVIGEAMACGIPCVVTNVGDSAAIVGDFGWVTPPGDPIALADACLDVILNLTPELKNSVRRHIERNYSLDTVVTSTEMALENLLKPTIIHVITTLDVGGAERMLARLVTNSTRCRAVVASMTGKGKLGSTLISSGVPIVDLGMRRGIPSPVGLWRLIRLIWREKPALLQSWMYHADLLATVAGALTGTRVAWNLRCSDLDFSQYRSLTKGVVKLLSRLSRFPVAVLTNSAIGLRVHEDLGYHPRRWELVPNGVDLSVCRPDPRARHCWRKRLGAREDTVLVGMLARRDPMKDHEGFLTAARIVSTERPNVAFVLAGLGVEESDLKLADLAKEVRAPVHLLGFCDVPQALMASWDIAVLASRFGEGFPNVIAEAMACEVPCVVTDVGESATIVGNTGYVVPRMSPELLAKAIIALIDNADARHERGALARKRIAEKFALRTVVARYEDLFLNLIEEGKRD